MSQAAEHTITPTARGSKALRSKIEKAPRKKPNSKPTAVSPTYVYEIRVDGLVRYIGKGRNGRVYSHMIEAQRTADKRGVKVANLSPHFWKMLVSAIRRGAKIKEKIIAADLTDDAAYALERHMIGTFHKNHPGQLWNTIDERFMSAEYLPDDWSNPVDPLYKVPRPLTPVDGLNGEASPRFFGQVIPSASGPGRLAARKAGAPPATRDPKQKAGRASLTHSSTPKSSSQNRTMLEKVMRRSLTDPRFKLAKRSGKGFAIVWANHDARR